MTLPTTGLGYRLAAASPRGRKFVALADSHASEFSARVAGHDLAGTFSFENFKEMQVSGFLAGTVPSEAGGLGVDSLHEFMVGMSRLAYGDPSTAIAANMHLAGACVAGQMMRRARKDGDEPGAAMLEGMLTQVAAGSLILCFPTTERGTDLMSPYTEAVPVDGGYIVNGRKIFGTVSPVADMFFPSVRIAKPEGGYLTGTAILPRATEGLAVEDNWDALGMRSSGSNDITFTDCFVPAARMIAVKDNYGRIGQGFANFALTANIPLISCFLGVAEAAKDHAVGATTRAKGTTRRRMADRIPIQQIIAEIEISIATCRALLDRLGRLADDFLARHRVSDPAGDEANALMKELQCVKYVVNRQAIEVVDHAMIVTGGSAYSSSNPLSRLYRDVRAGPFMQPFAPYEALEYIGKVTLGLGPDLDR